MPSATPVALPSNAVRSKCAACSAAYPCSSTSRCCGSIVTASAIETPNRRWSKRSAPRTKPPCRTRSTTALGASGSGSSSHRSGGTSLTVSAPAAATRHAAVVESAPPGSTTLAPTSTTCPLAAMEAGCGLLVGGDDARSEVRPANRASLGDAAAADAGAGVASDATCASSWRTVGAAWASPPSRCASRLRSSTAPSESSPASISGTSAPTSPPITSETTARTASRSAGTPVGGARAARSSVAPWSSAVSCMSSGPFGGGAEAVCGGAASEATCASSWRTVGAALASPPSRCASRLRSSTAPSESSPASISGTSAPTSPPITSETTARTTTLASAGGSAGARPLPAGCAGALHRAERERRELDKLVGAPAERVHAAEAVRGPHWHARHTRRPAEASVGGSKAAADGGEVGGRVAHARVEARGQRGVDGARAAHAQRKHGGRRARAVREDADGRAALGRVVQQQRRQVDVSRYRVHRADARREHERWRHLSFEARRHLSRVGRRPCARCVARRVAGYRVATMRGGERVLEGVAHELGARAEVEDQVVVRVHPRALTR
eukprot:scaffold48964_cov65-Phaeocystis_antarctica.AAC.1